MNNINKFIMWIAAILVYICAIGTAALLTLFNHPIMAFLILVAVFAHTFKIEDKR